MCLCGGYVFCVRGTREAHPLLGRCTIVGDNLLGSELIAALARLFAGWWAGLFHAWKLRLLDWNFRQL